MTRLYFKKVLYTVLTIWLILTVPSVAKAQDIPLDHWAAQDMLELKARGVLAGEQINPDAYITRAQFTKMIVTSLGLKLEALRLQGAPSPFIDVPKDHSLKGYIIAAKERGLVGGYTAHIFKPEEVLRRDQMIVLLLRVMGLDELKAEDRYLQFEDVDYIPDYALPSISEGVRLGLVRGFADNTFRPETKVTAAQAAAFINRWLDLKGDRYDYYGTFASLDREKNILSLNVDDSVISIPLNHKVQVLVDGKPAPWSEIAVADQIAVKLNILDEAVVVNKEQTELGDIQISLDARDLPRLNQESALSLQTTGLFNPRLPLDLEDVGESLRTTKAEINLPSLVSLTGSDGTGKVVAIIDTGVDPSHSDLATTTNGSPKIIDWVDFTLEGLVNMSMVPGSQNTVKWEGKEYVLGDIPSRSGIFRIGTLNTTDITPLELMEYEDEGQKIGVLLTDSSEAGVYDTVYVDTNADGNFADEKALQIYRDSHNYAMLANEEQNIALVVVDIDPEGKYIQLANDISGHGTHVAGIIAANGQVKGVAPGAQLMVLKAVDKDGYADPANIIEAIRYAAIHGADIINISLGQYQDIEPGQSDLAQIVNEVVRKYGVVVVTAAGNNGPGINTVAAPADADSAISVGAFVSPRMWETDFGYNVPQDSLYYFSSIGPRRDGAWYPSITAPGSAVSTVPSWMNNPYMLTEGTSMAAPHVSGVITHLLQNADEYGIKATPAFIKRAIEESARDLKKFTAIEDGHGVLDAYGAWLKLKELNGARPLSGTLFSPEYGSGPGVYAREYIPQRLVLNIKNHSNQDYSLQWSASEDWLKSELKTTYVMRGGSREIPILFDLTEETGLYSGVLIGDDPEIPGIEIEVPINIVIGKKVHTQRPYTYNTLGSLKPAQFARYFVQVPQGTSYIKAKLEIFPNTSGSYEGRGRIHLVDPFGFEEEMSEYAGLAPYALARKDNVEIMSFVPEAGTWEVVVYSSASLSEYNAQKTQYQLSMELGDVINIDSITEPDLDLVISPLPKAVLKKTKGTVILHIWDKKAQQPYNGALEVNGKFFEIENGRLEYDVNKIKKGMRLRFTVLK